MLLPNVKFKLIRNMNGSPSKSQVFSSAISADLESALWHLTRLKKIAYIYKLA
jgi:hypothetical protein